MKNLNLTETQAVELRTFYGAELSKTQDRVEELKELIRKLDGIHDGSSAGSISSGKRRGRKPGFKPAKSSGRRGRPAKIKLFEDSASESILSSGPKKRGRKPGTKKVKDASAPKGRRGRPAKIKNTVKSDVVGNGAVKRRGRPKLKDNSGL